MSDDTEPDVVGKVNVQVSTKAIYKAVRNYITQELKIDADTLRRDAAASAEKVVQERVVQYLQGTAYGEAQLRERVERAVGYYERKMEELVRAAVKSVVESYVARELSACVEMVLKNTEFKVGYGVGATRLKVTAVPPANGG